MSALTSPRPLTRDRTSGFDIERIRADFPILHRNVHGKPLVYLDNANTSQKPEAVIASIDRFYREENSNIHRGTHLLSELATAATRERERRSGASSTRPSLGRSSSCAGPPRL